VIAEAIDAAVSVGWALLVWVLLLAAAATAALYTLVVAAAIACMAVRRGVAACLAAVQRHEAPVPPPGPQRAADARVAHSRPTWAQPDKDAA
jgi:hypothetical protein